MQDPRKWFRWVFLICAVTLLVAACLIPCREQTDGVTHCRRRIGHRAVQEADTEDTLTHFWREWFPDTPAFTD